MFEINEALGSYFISHLSSSHVHLCPLFCFPRILLFLLTRHSHSIPFFSIFLLLLSSFWQSLCSSFPSTGEWSIQGWLTTFWEISAWVPCQGFPRTLAINQNSWRYLSNSDCFPPTWFSFQAGCLQILFLFPTHKYWFLPSQKTAFRSYFSLL